MDIVRSYLRKIGGLDRVTTSAEGIVFVVDGMSYKFTGNFAPINQVLGILKYGRIKTNVAKENILRRFDNIINEAIETVSQSRSWVGKLEHELHQHLPCQLIF